MTLQSFLTALFPPDGAGLIELRALPSKARDFFKPGDADGIKRFIRAHPQQNIYFGVATRKSRMSGELENCGLLTALFVDIDFKSAVHPNGIPEPEVRAKLQHFPLKPSIIVHSGGGLYLYFLLREPLNLEDPADRQRAYSLLQGLAKALGGDPICAQPACILRIPGTVNHKYTPARPVLSEVFNPDLRYNPSDLNDLLPREPEATTNGHNKRFRVKERIREGERNDTLYKLARSLKARDLSLDAMLAALLKENELKCDPPLDDAEVRRIAAHAYEQADRGNFEPNGNPGSTGEREQARERSLTVRLADVQPEPMSWLWPGRIPRGKLTLFIGDPGFGKSLLTLDVTARMSLGLPFPDGGLAAIGDTILLSAEDGPADTIRPRFDAAGGDPTRVHVLTAIRDQTGERNFDLARDLTQLEREITHTKAVLVVIDPIDAYLPEKTDSHRNAAVRRVLTPLAALADRLHVAVVAVMHLTKNEQTRAIYRAQGSIGFAAAARAVFAVGQDRADKERRLFVCVKINIAKKPPALAYKIEARAGQPVIAWEERAIDVDVESVLGSNDAEQSDVEEAVAFLRELLNTKSMKSSEVFELSRQAGIADRTLWRAKKKVGAKATRQGEPGGGGYYLWELPNSANTPPTDNVADLADKAESQSSSIDKQSGSIMSANSATIGENGTDGNLGKQATLFEEVIP